MGDAEAFAAGIDKFSFQFSWGGESNTVHENVQLAVTLFELRECSGDFFVPGDVAHETLGTWERIDQVFGFLGEALVLVGQPEVHAGGVQALRDGPGDGSLVRDSKDDSIAALEVVGHGRSPG